jgi:hypothetical protein
MPVILATQKAEIRKIPVGTQPSHIVCQTLSLKTPSQKRVGGEAVGGGFEFKSQYCNKQKVKKVFKKSDS